MSIENTQWDDLDASEKSHILEGMVVDMYRMGIVKEGKINFRSSDSEPFAWFKCVYFNAGFTKLIQGLSDEIAYLQNLGESEKTKNQKSKINNMEHNLFFYAPNDQQLWDIAEEHITLMQEKNLPLSKAANHFLDNYIENNKRPKWHKERTTMARDYAICLMVGKLHEIDKFQISSNQISNNHGSFDIVSKAFRRYGYHMSPDAIKKVWQRHASPENAGFCFRKPPLPRHNND